MTANSSFHVRHDFKPSVARDVLLLLRTLGTADPTALMTGARDRDLEIGSLQSPDKILAALHDLGMVERSSPRQQSTISLTPLGRSVANIAARDKFLFAELIHMRYRLLWRPEKRSNYFSWAYRTISDLLWDEAPTPIDTNRLVATVITLAEEKFGGDGIYGVSFSSSSLLGILHWLRALKPLCVVDGTFQRRVSCPAEALVIALEGVGREHDRSQGMPVRVDSRLREEICRAILIDPSAFDEMLDQAEESMGLVRRRGDGGEMVLLPGAFVPGLFDTSYLEQ